MGCTHSSSASKAATSAEDNARSVSGLNDPLGFPLYDRPGSLDSAATVASRGGGGGVAAASSTSSARMTRSLPGMGVGLPNGGMRGAAAGGRGTTNNDKNNNMMMFPPPGLEPVMTQSEMEIERTKRGQCPTCGQRCFEKRGLKIVPITDFPRVLNGRCLTCEPLEVGSPTTTATTTTDANAPHTANNQHHYYRQQPARQREGALSTTTTTTTGGRGGGALHPLGQKPSIRSMQTHGTARSPTATTDGRSVTFEEDHIHHHHPSSSSSSSRRTSSLVHQSRAATTRGGGGGHKPTTDDEEEEQQPQQQQVSGIHKRRGKGNKPNNIPQNTVGWELTGEAATAIMGTASSPATATSPSSRGSAYHHRSHLYAGAGASSGASVEGDSVASVTSHDDQHDYRTRRDRERNQTSHDDDNATPYYRTTRYSDPRAASTTTRRGMNTKRSKYHNKEEVEDDEDYVRHTSGQMGRKRPPAPTTHNNNDDNTEQYRISRRAAAGSGDGKRSEDHQYRSFQQHRQRGGEEEEEEEEEDAEEKIQHQQEEQGESSSTSERKIPALYSDIQKSDEQIKERERQMRDFADGVSYQYFRRTPKSSDHEQGGGRDRGHVRAASGSAQDYEELMRRKKEQEEDDPLSATATTSSLTLLSKQEIREATELARQLQRGFANSSASPETISKLVQQCRANQRRVMDAIEDATSNTTDSTTVDLDALFMLNDLLLRLLWGDDADRSSSGTRRAGGGGSGGGGTHPHDSHSRRSYPRGGSGTSLSSGGRGSPSQPPPPPPVKLCKDEMELAKEVARELRKSANNPDAELDVVASLVELCKSKQKKVVAALEDAIQSDSTDVDLDAMVLLNELLLDSIEMGGRASSSAAAASSTSRQSQITDFYGHRGGGRHGSAVRRISDDRM